MPKQVLEFSSEEVARLLFERHMTQQGMTGTYTVGISVKSTAKDDFNVELRFDTEKKK